MKVLAVAVPDNFPLRFDESRCPKEDCGRFAIRIASEIFQESELIWCEDMHVSVRNIGPGFDENGNVEDV